MSRVIAWFSSGAASAVMTKLALSNNPNVLPVMCDLGDSEDADNRRFTADCEAWFGKPVQRIRGRYANVDEVFEARKHHAGIAGAPCTGELKVAPRLDFQLPSDSHLWGYTADSEDVARWERMLRTYPVMRQRAPLIERGLTKEACHAILERAGIARPRVYDLGFPNGNCVGCVKATSPSYWAVVGQFEIWPCFLYGPRFPGFASACSTSIAMSAISQRRSETPAAIAGDVRIVLWMRTKL